MFARLKNLKLPKLMVLVSFFVLLAVLSSSAVFGVEYSNKNDPDKAPTLKDLEVVFQNVIQVVGTLAGLAFLFMIISGGFKFLTSEGDPKALDSAKSTLTFAVVGLIGIVLAYIIIKFIADFTGLTGPNGLNLLRFCIPIENAPCF